MLEIKPCHLWQGFYFEPQNVNYREYNFLTSFRYNYKVLSILVINSAG
jgi:hypothetical protein